MSEREQLRELSDEPEAASVYEDPINVNGSDDTMSLRAYRTLRGSLLSGEFLPGAIVSMRPLAKDAAVPVPTVKANDVSNAVTMSGLDDPTKSREAAISSTLGGLWMNEYSGRREYSDATLPGRDSRRRIGCRVTA